MSSVFSLPCDKLRLLGDKRGKSVRRDFGQSHAVSLEISRTADKFDGVVVISEFDDRLKNSAVFFQIGYHTIAPERIRFVFVNSEKNALRADFFKFGQCFFASDIRQVTIIYGYGYFVHFTPPTLVFRKFLLCFYAA